jgi:hypothetical protein
MTSHTYADLGPPIPVEAPDGPPLRILHLNRLEARNSLGEAVILVDALADGVAPRPIKLIIRLNPHSGAITGAAMLLTPGAGFIAIDPSLLPGNMVDLATTIALDR